MLIVILLAKVQTSSFNWSFPTTFLNVDDHQSLTFIADWSALTLPVPDFRFFH